MKIELTKEEIKLVGNALNLAYNSLLKVISDNRKVLNDISVDNILNEAHKYDDVLRKIDSQIKP
jgi:hypothetical protein